MGWHIEGKNTWICFSIMMLHRQWKYTLVMEVPLFILYRAISAPIS